MSARPIIAGGIAGLAGVLILVAVALADTCCANTSVGLEPKTTVPGDTVRLEGIACLDYDNSGPLELNLMAFWLSTDAVPADPDPGSVPGGGARLADDLPSVEEWLPFESVTGAGAASSGAATIVVPAGPRGSYQLWWLCDNGAGPGSGIHYSGGPRLQVGLGTPATSTVEPPPVGDAALPAAFVLLPGVVAAMVMANRLSSGRHRHD